MHIRKTIEFIRKDFIVESSYKLAFIIALLNYLLPIVSLFFVGKTMAGNRIRGIERYGTDYFSFALVGTAFSSYFQLAVSTFSGSIKRAQMAGCLEAILSSQTSPRAMVVMSSFYSFISAMVQLILMLTISHFILGFDVSKLNFISTLVTTLLSVAIFICLGIFSAAGTVIFKQAEPVSWLFGVVSGLLGGAMFPVAVMPEWLRLLASIFPITWSLDAVRLAMLKGYSIDMLIPQLLMLTAMTIILFPLSLLTFKWAVEKGKRDGTLMQY